MEKNEKKTQLKGQDILGKNVSILGEIGAGKTKLAAQLLQELMTLVKAKRITVIDLAPKRTGKIGGKITEYVKIDPDITYFSPRKVYTPRLAGNSPRQVLQYAELNRKSMEPLFNSFMQNVTNVLILNDVTLYLHSGKLETILKCARSSETFLATAYYGSKLAYDLGTGLSARERQLTDKLTTFMDLTVRIS